MFRGMLLVAAAPLLAQDFEVTPASVRQGETVHVRGPATAATARLNGRTVRLFPQAGGTTLGLMPIRVLEKPGSYKLEFSGADGAPLHTAEITVRDAHYPKQNVVMGQAIAGLKPAPGEMETAAEFRKAVSEQRYWAEPLAAPVSGCLSSLFGVARYRNGKPTGDYHGGVDQRAPMGTPVHAVAAGVVRLVKQWSIHGNTVGVDHGQGLESIYLHLSRFAVAEGATVQKGAVIGYVGSSGRSTGPHLHWSLYVNGVPVNPSQWMTLRACAAPTRSGKAKPAAPRR